MGGQPEAGEPGMPLLFCDGRIFARSWGDPIGLAILCWHGAGGSSADYASLAAELAYRLGARVVAVDGPGHAQSSPRAADAFRPSALAGLAIEILDELDATQAVFVGFSWGATVGCWFAALNPERTLALALIDGGHFDFADLPDFRTAVRWTSSSRTPKPWQLAKARSSAPTRQRSPLRWSTDSAASQQPPRMHG